ncbi:hypothetical protein ACJX0J_025336, partial [Zea mays]
LHHLALLFRKKLTLHLSNYRKRVILQIDICMIEFFLRYQFDTLILYGYNVLLPFGHFELGGLPLISTISYVRVEIGRKMQIESMIPIIDDKNENDYSSSWHIHMHLLGW